MAKPTSPLAPVAIIDLGINAAHLEIYQIRDDKLEQLELLQQSVQLGSDIFTKNKIGQQSMREVARICHDFKTVIDQYPGIKVRALLSGAVREASNVDTLLNRLRVHSGLNFSLLSNAEEMKLNFLLAESAQKAIGADPSHNHSVIARIGRSNTDFLFTRHGQVSHAQSLRFGTLRLLGNSANEMVRRQLIDEAGIYISGLVEDVSAKVKPAEPLLSLVGGSVRLLATLCQAELKNKAWKLSLDSLNQFYLAINGLETMQLAAQFKISDAEAMALEPTVLMAKRIFEVIGVNEAVIPRLTVRQALANETADRLRQLPDRFEPQILSATRFLAHKFQCNLSHAEAVSQLALDLFDRLQSQHGLTARDRLLLQVAAILHDAGMFISPTAHHKHSLYLIRNSHIPGLSIKEQNLVALTARYHRKALPSSNHSDYTGLSLENRIRVSQLSALLRIADALDCSHSDAVVIHSHEFTEDQLILKVQARHSIELEQRALKKKSDLFSEVFGYKLKLIPL